MGSPSVLSLLHAKGLAAADRILYHGNYRMIKRSGLKLDSFAYSYMLQLWQDFGKWMSYPGGLEGKTVLEAGSCCGETAYFFLTHGAERVIAIEGDPRRALILSDNVARLGLNVDVIARRFELPDLDLPHDVSRINIEGYELLLLEYDKPLKPMVVDAHNWYVVEKLSEIGFHPITEPEPMMGHCTMANFGVTPFYHGAGEG